ncbi:MAG TPA: ABC transporter substrate-binding protein [Gaiellaceae bacterium]|jgi:polar amino acid transport system substrate-binding protein|nr:ABC transporter substrate-binding protein [Gaiellaceae bacterium]
MGSNRTIAAILVALAAASWLGVATAAAAPAAKTIVFCSDTTYPPMESLQGGKAVGADVDIAGAVAKVLGAQAQIKSTGFDVIIPALLDKKCDAIISAMTDTPARAKQVDFTDYVTVGAFLMVKKGNPSHVSTLASLSGKSVAVEAATTEKAGLDAENKVLSKSGKSQITIKIYPADTSAAAALLAGKVDAYFADATPVLFYIKKTGGKFEVAGNQVEAAPEGIATRKGDPLGAQIKTAIAKLYANGTMKTILAKWGISAFALKK